MPKTIIETHKLYNGEVELLYYPNSHAYKVNGDKKIGVSSIPDIIDKPGLRHYYMNEALEFLRMTLDPNNTGEFINVTNIEKWDGWCALAKVYHKQKSNRGKENGTRIHAWLESFMIAMRDNAPAPLFPESVTVLPIVNGMTWDQLIKNEINLEFNNLIEALKEFVHWFENHKVKVVAFEEIVYSRRYDYAGRYDAILEIDGKLYLVDFKTNNPTKDYPNGIFPEMFCQIGGYDVARTEEYAPELDTKNQSMFDGHAVFNFSKKTGRFSKQMLDGEDVRVNRAWFVNTLGTKRGAQYYTRKLSMQYKENRSK